MTQAQFGAATDVGRVRDLNEDCVLAAPPAFVVADGMGGHAAGEVAADLASQAFARFTGREDLKREDVLGAIADANSAILACTSAHAETAGMGTTLTGLCLGSVGGTPHWFVFNVGDSRVYRFNEGELSQVTVDHSEVEELIAAGLISSADARHHPRRNVVTRSLGSDPAPTPDIWVLPATPGECFVICSDGLTTEVEDAQIALELGRGAPAQETADALVAMANAAGGRDNVSVIVVRVATESASDADVATAPRRGLVSGS